MGASTNLPPILQQISKEKRYGIHDWNFFHCFVNFQNLFGDIGSKNWTSLDFEWFNYFQVQKLKFWKNFSLLSKYFNLVLQLCLSQWISKQNFDSMLTHTCCHMHMCFQKIYWEYYVPPCVKFDFVVCKCVRS